MSLTPREGKVHIELRRWLGLFRKQFRTGMLCRITIPMEAAAMMTTCPACTRALRAFRISGMPGCVAASRGCTPAPASVTLETGLHLRSRLDP